MLLATANSEIALAAVAKDVIAKNVFTSILLQINLFSSIKLVIIVIGYVSVKENCLYHS